MFQKVFGILTAIASVVVAVWVVDERYALAEDLKYKADTAIVKALQQSIVDDKIAELEYQEFFLEKKQVKTDLEEFRLKQIKERLIRLRKTK